MEERGGGRRKIKVHYKTQNKDAYSPQIFHEMFVDQDKIARQYPAREDVAVGGIDSLKVVQDVGRAGGGHLHEQLRVAQPVELYAALESGPVPPVARLDAPKVELQQTLAGRTAGIRFVGAVLASELVGLAHGAVIDGLEYVPVESGRLLTFP